MLQRACVKPACAMLIVFAASARAEEPMIFPVDRPVDCLHIKLVLKLDIPGKSLKGEATIDLAALRDVESIRFDAVEFETTRVAMVREPEKSPRQSAAPAVEYRNDGRSITVVCRPPLQKGQRARITIDYSIENPASGLHFFGPSEDEPDVPLLVWSQGESCDNRYWFPCFDHPGERQTTELIVTTAAGNEVVSNGKLVERSEDKSAGSVTFHWLQGIPHAAYLVTLAAGPFAVVEETWRGRPVRYYVQPRYEKWVKRSFGRTIPMLDFFSEKIGVEYPWDQYAQVCCYAFGGGMENTSATTLGEHALHDERSMLDSDSDDLIAHEMAHQWWGDMVTCKDWAHTWLNEGFASYFDPLWTEHHKGADEFAYDMWHNARSAINGGKDKPIVYRRYGNPDTQFDARAYPKGAWVLHMLRSRLGDDLWWKCIHRYATDHRFECVETVDLRKSFEAESGRNLERFFYDWTERPGHPVVELSCDWQEDDKLEKIRVRQTQKDEAFEFPLVLELHAAGRDPVVLRRDIREKDEAFYVSLPHPPSLIRVDPSNTVLWELTQVQGHDLWKGQLCGDANPIGRIRAAQHFGKSRSDRDTRLLADALAHEKFWGVQREIAAALKEAGGEIARDALVAGIRHENPKVRRACADMLGSFRDEPAVTAALRAIVEKGDPSYYVEAAAIESFGKLQPMDGVAVLKPLLSRDSRFDEIRRAVLSALGAQRDPAVVPVLIEWTRRGKPRECRSAAISALAQATRNTHLDDSTMEGVVTALAACLPGGGRSVQRSAVAALESLGAAARPALPALEGLTVRGPRSSRLEGSVERAIKKIRDGEPVQVQMADLREEVLRLKKENESLKERISTMEGKGKARHASAGEAGAEPHPIGAKIE